jgi:hypothetical protein
MVLAKPSYVHLRQQPTITGGMIRNALSDACERLSNGIDNTYRYMTGRTESKLLKNISLLDDEIDRLTYESRTIRTRFIFNKMQNKINQLTRKRELLITDLNKLRERIEATANASYHENVHRVTPIRNNQVLPHAEVEATPLLDTDAEVGHPIMNVVGGYGIKKKNNKKPNNNNGIVNLSNKERELNFKRFVDLHSKLDKSKKGKSIKEIISEVIKPYEKLNKYRGKDKVLALKAYLRKLK